MSTGVRDWYQLPEGISPEEVSASTEARGGGYVYLLCFAGTPYHHARHYLGATGKTLEERLKAHRGQRGPSGESLGRPAKLVAAMLAAGGDFVLAKSWSFANVDDAFAFERKLKEGGGGVACCPICKPGNRRGEGKAWRKGMIKPVADPKRAAANTRRRLYAREVRAKGTAGG